MEHRTENTRWTPIRGAAAGRAADREEFARPGRENGRQLWSAVDDRFRRLGGW